MRVRLLFKAAMLLAIWIGPVANANEPGTVTDVDSKRKLEARLLESEEEIAIPDATTPLRAFRGRSPRVLLITSQESAACEKELARLQSPGGEFASMKAQGWKIGISDDSHVQLIDRSEVVDLLRQLDDREFPVVACISDDEVVRSFKDGCSTPLDAWTFGWLLKGVSERPRGSIPEEIRVTTTGNYPLRGNHWSVDGATNPNKEYLIAHLRSATHVSYLNASYKIEDWSIEELKSLHDDLHERYGPAAPVAASSGARTTGLEQFSGNRKALGK